MRRGQILRDELPPLSTDLLRSIILTHTPALRDAEPVGMTRGQLTVLIVHGVTQYG
jgi:hypothetical protein